MRAMRLAAALAVLGSLTATGVDAQRAITGETVVVLQAWMEAVRTHVPGRLDPQVEKVAAYTYETREELHRGMTLFLRVLMGRMYDTGRNKAAETIAAMGHAAGRDFLKQAAVLHADAAAYTFLHPDSVPGARDLPPRRPSEHPGVLQNDAVSPLLTVNRLLLHKDGQVVGEMLASWHWPFARSLLDLLIVRIDRRRDGLLAADPFVSDWYHATNAYIFSIELYGDAFPQLRHAAEMLPDDARVLFDRGCFSEAMGLPMHQALAPARLEAVRSNRAFRLPSEAATNQEAEELYRRALAIDPALVEARVRLARLLGLRKRHAEAATELATALAGNPTGVLAFYAHLFAGRTAQALGRAADASRHYQAALALFPDAQSALLASSQLALLGSNVPAALSPVERLGPKSVEFAADPWWQYHLCAGRDADALLAALWASVPQP